MKVYIIVLTEFQHKTHHWNWSVHKVFLNEKDAKTYLLSHPALENPCWDEEAGGSYYYSMEEFTAEAN